MKVLVLNCGSSSLKYQLYDMNSEDILAYGRIEKIGHNDAILTHHEPRRDAFQRTVEILDHKSAISLMVEILSDPSCQAIQNLDEIEAVGHRVVHGGEKFSESVLVTPEVEQAIRDCIDLAPLHNPASLLGIFATKEILPSTPQVVVFDTAFHQTLERQVYLYGIPMELYNKHKVRKYGFHGTSHKYVSERAADLLDRPLETLKIISCHIGNGSSITAIRDGISVDTSMGMTPLEGLIMGTRSGDIDPAAVLYIMNKEEITTEEMNAILNYKSGLLGISGISGDMREIVENAQNHHPLAKLAFDMYEYRIRKYIGSYAAAMNGIDVLLFTAGVGENSAELREKICENISYLGVELDCDANRIRSGEERMISTARSRVKVLVIPTNEELVIARDTQTVVKSIY